MRRQPMQLTQKQIQDDVGNQYMDDISKNPFQVPLTDSHRQMVEEKHKLEMLFMKATPIHKSCDNQSKAQMLALKDQPQIKTRPATCYAKTTNMLSYSQLKDQLYAPVKQGVFSNLDEADKVFLEQLPRNAGPKEPVDDFLLNQKKIFLLGLNLEDKKKERDRLAGDLKQKEISVTRQEEELQIELDQFNIKVRNSDLNTVSNVMLQEMALKNKVVSKQVVDGLRNDQMRTQSEIDRLLLTQAQLQSQKGFLLDLAGCQETLAWQNENSNAIRAKLLEYVLAHDSSAEGFCLECCAQELQRDRNESLSSQASSTRPVTQLPQSKNQKQLSSSVASFQMKNSLDSKSTKQCQHASKVNYSLGHDELLNYLDDFRGIKHTDVELEIFLDVVMGTYREQTEMVPFTSIDELINSLATKDKQNEGIQEYIHTMQTQADQYKDQAQRRMNLKQQEVNAIQTDIQRILNRKTPIVEQKKDDSAESLQLKKDQLNKLEKLIEAIYKRVQNENPNGLGALSMLGQLEQKLEKLGRVCEVFEKRKVTNVVFSAQNQITQKIFEKREELKRQKKLGDLKAVEKEIIFKEKMQKYADKVKDPVIKNDVKQVKNKVVWEKRKVSGSAVRSTAEKVDIDFFGEV
ncbi:Conserved_hypothetical protein [Hexamita inflata]|uniref:Uncharacterized protein n=1 Tax=Hexamita inflata TaxID=28002 RepID=A0AA86NS65_9EUKA|nr:Conserved hypothetical protein [Hexamita inflata]